MTINAVYREDAIGNDTATSFDYLFKIFAATHLDVRVKDSVGVETTLTYPTHYSVTGVGRSAGGTVVLAVVGGAWQNANGTLKTGYSMAIRRVVPVLQGTDIRNQGGFFADVHEDAFDYMTMIMQQHEDALSRAFLLPASYDPADFDLELPAPLAGAAIGWSATADSLVNLVSLGGVAVSAFMATVLDDVNAAAARTTLGFTGSGGTIPYSLMSTAVQQAISDLRGFYHANTDTGHRDMIASGLMPAFFNQQWGGAPHYFEMADGATGVTYRFEVATQQIEQDAIANVASAAGNTGVSQGFKVSKSDSYAAIWVKIYKTGNPANNLEMRIQADDGTGTKPTANFTAITNGTATAQSGKLHSSDTNGQWVRFVFPTPCALAAGTQYWLTLKSSGAVDPANFWVWQYKSTGKYPHGNYAAADATPTWTAAAALDLCFLVEAPSTTASLQAGDSNSPDGYLTFFEGSPLNQSNGRVKNLRDFAGLDLTDCTIHIAGKAWTKDKTILDIQYGMDHDRIVLRSNVTTGFAQVDVYDSAGSKKTVTATSVDLSSGYHHVALKITAKGAGADVVGLYVDSAANGSQLSSQTISFDKLFGAAQIGTLWIGGGFQVTPAWTKDTAMGVLPSADGWTWTTGTASVEANCMSIQGGKLMQNKGGYAAGGDGNYLKNALALSNANGHASAYKVRASSNTNTKDSGGINIAVYDGAKLLQYFPQEFYGVAFAAAGVYPQLEHKAYDSVVYIIGKGSDAMMFKDGRLVTDFTGINTGATALNQIVFGDANPSANENADAVWDYVKYYNTAWLPPQFTSGSLSEFAIWNGDKTSILATLYNSGAPISVKQFCGTQKNYVGDEVVQLATQHGIVATPSTNSVYPALAQIPEMERFVVGSQVKVDYSADSYNDTNAFASYRVSLIDGYPMSKSSGLAWGSAGANYQTLVSSRDFVRVAFGLHKAEVKYAAQNPSTTQDSGTGRRMVVEARA